MMLGKFYNSRWVLERACRDHKLQVNVDKLKKTSRFINELSCKICSCNHMSELLGIEGKAADAYFSVFNELILQQKQDFVFSNRNRRPPTDNVNALLSFFYTLLAHDCASALECVGLDAYVGFYHQDRPGRLSLALDLMEELRSVMVDRFVLSLINKKIVKNNDFWIKENGAVVLNDDARKNVIALWQERKNDTIKHPFLEENIAWGLVPFAQAQLLARFLRGDLNEYPPFFWK